MLHQHDAKSPPSAQTTLPPASEHPMISALKSSKAAHFLLKHARKHKRADPTTSNKHRLQASFQGCLSVKGTSQVKGQLQSDWRPPIHLILSSQDALHKFQAQLLV